MTAILGVAATLALLAYIGIEAWLLAVGFEEYGWSRWWRLVLALALFVVPMTLTFPGVIGKAGQ